MLTVADVVALGLIVSCLAPALLLPRRRSAARPGEERAAAPALMH